VLPVEVVPVPVVLVPPVVVVVPPFGLIALSSELQAETTIITKRHTRVVFAKFFMIISKFKFVFLIILIR
jgi:hypothetical protein